MWLSLKEVATYLLKTPSPSKLVQASLTRQQACERMGIRIYPAAAARRSCRSSAAAAASAATEVQSAELHHLLVSEHGLGRGQLLLVGQARVVQPKALLLLLLLMLLGIERGLCCTLLGLLLLLLLLLLSQLQAQNSAYWTTFNHFTSRLLSQ